MVLLDCCGDTYAFPDPIAPKTHTVGVSTHALQNSSSDFPEFANLADLQAPIRIEPVFPDSVEPVFIGPVFPDIVDPLFNELSDPFFNERGTSRTTMSEARKSRSSAASTKTTTEEIVSMRISEINIPREKMWRNKVVELAGRGMLLSQILEFYAELFTIMPHFDPTRSTTRDVVRGAIIPMTVERTCAYATLVNDGDARIPDCMVTHHWGNLFAHTIAAIVADALESPTFQHIAIRLDSLDSVFKLQTEVQDAGMSELVYWICAFGVDQHASICDGLDENERDSVTDEMYDPCTCGIAKHFWGPLCEMNKFSDMMRQLREMSPAFRQIVAVDIGFSLFSRAWCIAEIVEANQTGMLQELKIFSPAHVRNSIVTKLDVRNCEASRPEDKAAILESIPDIDKFNAMLQEMMFDSHTGLFAQWVFAAKIAQYLSEGAQVLTGYLSESVQEWGLASTVYSERVAVASCASPLYLFTLFSSLVVLPPLLAIVIVTLPYAAADATWNEQGLWFFFGNPCMEFTVMTTFPCYFADLLSLEFTRFLSFRIFTWVVAVALVLSSGCLLSAIILDVFPLPLTHIAGAIVALMAIPFLWICVPTRERNHKDFPKLALLAVVTSLTCTIIGAICFPLLNSLLVQQKPLWQSCLIIVYLVGKLSIDQIGRKLSMRLGSSTIPLMTFLAATLYELNLCVALSGPDTYWLSVVELIAFDFIENSYHIVCLLRWSDGPSVDLQVCVVLPLVLREFVELMIPIQLLFELSMMNLIRPRFIDSICSLDDDAISRMRFILFADIACETIIALLTYIVLRRFDYSPFMMLSGLVRVHFIPFISLAGCVHMYWLTMWHSHWGMDLSFGFRWLRYENLEWRCGLRWYDP